MNYLFPVAGFAALILLSRMGKSKGKRAKEELYKEPTPSIPWLGDHQRAMIRTLDPVMQGWLMNVLTECDDRGLRPSVVSARRTCEQQNAIYAQGRTSPGPVVTQARGCQSWHVHGRAVDLAFPESMGKAPYEILGAIAKERGGKWGGDFSFWDGGHIEYHPGLALQDVCPDPDKC